jgi:choline dehydrogenase-like flavoprotein
MSGGILDGRAAAARGRTWTAEVCVIGSGAGGAVVAERLAAAGRDVVCVEEGAAFGPQDFRGPIVERVARMYRDGGATVAVGRPVIPVPLGCTLGGTTTINSGTFLRPPDEVVARWRDREGLGSLSPESVRPYLDDIERRLGVRPVPEHLLGGNIRVFRRGLERLGLNGRPLPRNATADCRGSGVCCFGCPTNAKQAMALSYIPQAVRHGEHFLTRTRAERLITRGGRVAGVRARTEAGPVEVRARAVVLAAGAIHLPAFLRAHGAGGHAAGEGLSLHPATRVAALFDEEVRGWEGVPQSYVVEALAGDGIMLEAIHGPPALIGMALPLSGRAMHSALEEYARIAAFGAMVCDVSRGRVRPRFGRPWITYDLVEEDARRFRAAAALLARIFLAAGARVVWLPVHGAPEVRSERELLAFERAAVRPEDWELAAFHPLGTCRMGRDPAVAVVDDYGRVHGVPGLWITDGSVVPSPPGVNPQATIMALAARTADAMLEEVRRG